MDIPRPSISHKYCIICRRENTYQKLRHISNQARVKAFLDVKILLKQGSRCCPSHLDENFNLKPDEVNKLVVLKHQNRLNKAEFESLINILREFAITNSIFKKFKDISPMTEEICKSYTRFTRELFILIIQNLNKMRDTDKRSI